MSGTTFFSRKVGVLLKIRDIAREQAAKNALTLFVMAVGFAITWVVIILASILEATRGH